VTILKWFGHPLT